jgi:hypothetical protein
MKFSVSFLENCANLQQIKAGLRIHVKLDNYSVAHRWLARKPKQWTTQPVL